MYPYQQGAAEAGFSGNFAHHTKVFKVRRTSSEACPNVTWYRCCDTSSEKVAAGAKGDVNSSLLSYVFYMFDNIEGAPYYPYEQIAKYWAILLQEKVCSTCPLQSL